MVEWLTLACVSRNRNIMYRSQEGVVLIETTRYYYYTSLLHNTNPGNISTWPLASMPQDNTVLRNVTLHVSPIHLTHYTIQQKKIITYHVLCYTIHTVVHTVNTIQLHTRPQHNTLLHHTHYSAKHHTKPAYSLSLRISLQHIRNSTVYALPHTNSTQHHSLLSTIHSYATQQQL